MIKNTLSRIKEYIDFKGINNANFEKEVGMSNGSFASQLKNNKTIGVDKLENILKIYAEINPDWLLTGKGSMLKSEANKGISQNITGDSNIQSGNDTSITGDSKQKIEKLEAKLQKCKLKLEKSEYLVSELISTVKALSQPKPKE